MLASYLQAIQQSHKTAGFFLFTFRRQNFLTPFNFNLYSKDNAKLRRTLTLGYT